MKYQGRNGEYFEIIDITADNCHLLKESRADELSLLWFTSDDNELKIDNVAYTLNTNNIISLTEFHQLETVRIHQLRLLRFNKFFYCIIDHDSEVGCKGVLYYGASNTPVLSPCPQDLDILQTVWKMLEIEMQSRDALQLEMLQMMLKRLLILCTRIYKKQKNFEALDIPNVDIIREFNYLVEQHFREKHSVAEYAELLNKAPKTLANLFKKLDGRSPLQFIQARILLEARRLLKYTDKTVSEISYELGYNDIQSFSRFFKKKEGLSAVDYRKK